MEVDGGSTLHALSQLIDFSSMHFGEQCSDEVTTAVEEFSPAGIAFKLGIQIFFAESD